MRERLEAGHYYHIYNRGNNRVDIFKEEQNYTFFLERYAYYCYPVLDTYAYCLLNNHFHLLVRVRKSEEINLVLSSDEKVEPSVSDRLSGKGWTPRLISLQLGHLFNSYTQAFNKKYGRTGSLFEKSFKRKKVDENNYFCNLVCYIHRNPQRHGMINDFREYSYSSYTSYLSENKTYINREESFRRFGGYESFRAIHEKKPNILDEHIIE